jgi:predicted CXXCH cytochrome family protein
MRVNRLNTSGSPDGNASTLSAEMTANPDMFAVAPSHAPKRFFTAAIFSHSAHSAVECLECHANAKTSVSGTNLLMPGIAVCQRCHDGQSRPQGPALSNGHAESGCSLCHEYHEMVALKDGLQPTPKTTFPISQLTSNH